MQIHFRPKLFSTLKTYTKEQFYSDLMAGVIVGIVAFPLAIAFGIASGVSPEKGLFTAIIAGFIISFLGGSNVQIGGPTGAFIVIVFGIVQEHGIVGLKVATLIAGIMLLIMGICRLGTVIKFVPYPVVVGFTSGIALTIFASQVKDLLGLPIESVPADFIHKWITYAKNISLTNFWSLGVGILSIVIIFMTPKYLKKIPGSLMAILLITFIVYFLREFFNIPIETIGDRFTINPTLPTLEPLSADAVNQGMQEASVVKESPKVDFQFVQSLLPVAFTIAMLGAIESLLSATVADGVTGDKHDSNTELMAQGVANMVTPIFGGIPATGAIARTMTNINNGGKTPVAGIIHAAVLVVIMLFLGGLTKHIPMACLSGILIVVAYNMSEWRVFKGLLHGSKSDVSVLITTFLLTVIFDLTIAIEVGLLLAILLFIRRMSESSNIAVFKNRIESSKNSEILADKEELIIPEGVEVYEIEGPFFFGVANKFEEVMKQIGDTPEARIIRMRKVPFVDSTGLHNLETLIKSSQKSGIKIFLSGVNAKVRKDLIKNDIDKLIGIENICNNIYQALEKAKAFTESPHHKRTH